ncbi:hypothetical protein [Epibacterium ulvae]|uniref:hypothetical protein n=1 Tax=Epibacterium ulvae TaxID=1156985 RepID=UPI00248FFCA1|nr:hypothetical protein [Epibacterium ulvae]
MITNHTISTTVKIGTDRDFQTARLIERVADLELSDGRTGALVRCASGVPYFEILIDGEVKSMRLNLADMMTAAVELLAQETQPQTGATNA